METLIIVSFIVSLILVFPFIKNGVVRLYLFLKRNILYGDISCRVLKHVKYKNSFTTKIKIAYVGNENYLEDIKFSYQLRYPAPIDRILASINIAIGYITCDMSGLTTMLGNKRYRFEPPMVHLWNVSKFIKYPLSVLYGLSCLYIITLMLLFPIVGWFFLFWGPYGKFSLDSIPDSMKIIADGKVVRLPIVLKKGDEVVLEINYRLGMNAKGFSNDTKYKLLDYFPKRTLRPPRPGNFTWVGRGAVSMCVGHRMNREMTEIGERVIVGIGG